MLFSACANANDQSLGPSVQGCRGDFDFTVKFEQLFFSITPSAIFIIASLWRTALLVRKPTIVGAPLLRLTKLVSPYIARQMYFLVQTCSRIKIGRPRSIRFLGAFFTSLRCVTLH